jgi:hypothetical protein
VETILQWFVASTKDSAEPESCPSHRLVVLASRSSPATGEGTRMIDGLGPYGKQKSNVRLKLSAHGLGRIPFVRHCRSCSSANSGAPLGLRAAA